MMIWLEFRIGKKSEKEIFCSKFTFIIIAMGKKAY